MSGAWLVPEWEAPPPVRALMTTRSGGRSEAPYAGLNLGDHVGDDAAAVAGNRRTLRTAARLPAEPLWLRQVHGTRAVVADDYTAGVEADACVARSPGLVCAVLTADCLPVLLCADDATVVAAAHAGWRGLAAGVIEACVAAMDVQPARLLAWLGPAIGPLAYEVGKEVRDAFCERAVEAAQAFVVCGNGKWRCNLTLLARQRLARLGVTRVSGGQWCTLSDPQRFYSHRRDGVTGRMAACIWLEDAAPL